MPVVTVEWLEGRTAEQKRQVAQALTQAFVDLARVPADQVWIVFRDVRREDWAIGGELLGQETGGKGRANPAKPTPRAPRPVPRR